MPLNVIDVCNIYFSKVASLLVKHEHCFGPFMKIVPLWFLLAQHCVLMDSHCRCFSPESLSAGDVNELMKMGSSTSTELF